ncbi:MAG: hypothetical protein HZA03_03095 [Nitrospinae bacterium]|nr:hypothetical protein [Nitrospinota bacterium]
MKKLLFTAFAAALLFAACGGGGGGTATTTTTTTPASTTAVQSSSAGTGAVSASTGTTTTFQNISKISVVGAGQAPKFKSISVPSGNAGLDSAALLTGRMGDSPLMKAAVEKAQMAAKAGPKAVTSAACTDGGTYAGAAGSTASSFVITFTNCKDGGNMYDGKVTMTLGAVTGSSVPITMTFAGNNSTTFKVTSFSGTYDIMVLKMEMNLTIVNTYTPGATSTAYTYEMVADGTMNLTDYSTTNTYAITFTGFGNTVVVSGTGTTFSTTISGKFAESWTDAGVSSSVTMTYTNFKVDMTDDLTNTTLSPSGTVSIAYTPSTKCSVTSVTVATVTPIKYVNASGKTIAGKITLNSTTSVTFNADGTVTVSDGTNSTSYASSYDMGKECPFAVPNADTAAPPATTSTTTTGVTATTMTVTSLSKEGATAGSLTSCYTDLHVNFYGSSTYTGTAPTATTAGTWYVDYHVSGCTNPSTFTFEQGKDVDGDSICDVGLDIKGSWTDDKSGGLEHFVAQKLPAGYYVISMNNYSCPIDTTNEVSIQLGSNVYGPYTASYTASSADGTTLGAWYRVRDVRVNANGTVDVLSPDTALEPWHSGTFGFAPKYPGKR